MGELRVQCSTCGLHGAHITCYGLWMAQRNAHHSVAAAAATGDVATATTVIEVGQAMLTHQQSCYVLRTAIGSHITLFVLTPLIVGNGAARTSSPGHHIHMTRAGQFISMVSRWCHNSATSTIVLIT